MKVLDHGFVELVETMGDDCSPAEAARVSYGNGKRGWDNGDGKLTSYLITNSHLTPFEMVELKFRVKAPIFVARQWMRHRAASYNEFSMRYSEAGKIGDAGHVEIYQPNFWGKGNSNKVSNQVSDTIEIFTEADTVYNNAIAAVEEAYEKLLNLGVSREHARLVLPVSTYTIFMYKTDLRNFWHFLDLRSSNSAQREIREYSEAMAQLASRVYPNLMSLYNARSN